MAERQTFEPDGRAVPYVDEGEGPAIALLVGERIELADLGVFTHILSDEGFRLILIGTRTDTAAATTADLAQDVVDLLDELSVADAWIGGHAAGGAIARAVALDNHERTNGVLLLSVEDDPAAAELPAGVPVLVVHGTDDDTSPITVAESVQSSAADRATLVRIEGAGHHFPVTHPGEAAFAIAEYLDWD